MNTYKVMMTTNGGIAKVKIIVAANEEMAMGVANLLEHNHYKAQFAIKMFAGSPAD